jgi:hypothetical protein
VQVRGIENIFSKIIGEIFPNIEKETAIKNTRAFRARKDYRNLQERNAK